VGWQAAAAALLIPWQSSLAVADAGAQLPAEASAAESALSVEPPARMSRFNWSALAQFGTGYDSNANASTSRQTFLGFTLSPGNVETASPFGELAVGAGTRFALGAASGIVSTAQVVHRANPDASFIDQTVGVLATNAVWAWRGTRVSVGVDGYTGRLDGAHHEHGVNFSAAASRRFGRYEGAAMLRGGSLDYASSSLSILETERYLAGVSLTRTDLGKWPGQAGVALLVGHDDAKQGGSPYGNNRYGVRTFGAMPVRVHSTAFVELSYLNTDYAGRFFGFSRNDDVLGATFGMDVRGFPFANWSIAPRIRYVKSSSSVSLYTYDRFEAAVFIRRELGAGRTPRADLARNASPDDASRQGRERRGRAIFARSAQGRVVDLNEALPPPEARNSVAIAAPDSSEAAFVTAATEPQRAFAFNDDGGLLQLEAPLHGDDAVSVTFDAGGASLIDGGSNGASGIRWGRWSTGPADPSLHWIAGPTFELTPVIPVSGFTHFVHAGGTSPTDLQGNVGTLSGASLFADFSAQQVTATLAANVNGNGWFASGAAPITAGTVRFGGAFSEVAVNGATPGSGTFSGFFSAGPLTPDQLNGAAISYQLSDSAHEHGTVSGVIGFIPGITPSPLTP